MHDTYASNMKTISARLLMLIAASNGYEVLTCDIKNAYLNAKNVLDVYVRLGKEFELYNGKAYKDGDVAIVEGNLYGLGTAARQWHAHLADTLRGLGFKPTRHDCDIWMRRSAKGKGYEYIGTHTDDLLVVANDAKAIMDALESKYEVSKVEVPTFHLGCDYKCVDGVWFQGSVTYSKECIKKVEAILTKELGKDNTPIRDTWKHEVDDSPMLPLAGHRKFQQLIGIAQWLITCGRVDIVGGLIV